MRHLCLIALVLSLPQFAFAQADITFVASTADTTNAAQYTFTNHAIGTAADDRCVVVAIHSGIANAVSTITGVTIGGNAATVVYQQDADVGSNSRVSAIAALLVTAGTTATIVVDLSGTANRIRIGTFTLTGTEDCTTLADSDFSEATDPSVALDVPENGSALGVCTDGGNATTTWAGITEAYDHSDESALMVSTAAADDFAAAQTGLTMTCDLVSTGDSAEIGVFVSWGPAEEDEEEELITPARIGFGIF